MEYKDIVTSLQEQQLKDESTTFTKDQLIELKDAIKAQLDGSELESNSVLGRIVSDIENYDNLTNDGHEAISFMVEDLHGNFEYDRDLLIEPPRSSADMDEGLTDEVVQSTPTQSKSMSILDRLSWIRDTITSKFSDVMNYFIGSKEKESDEVVAFDNPLYGQDPNDRPVSSKGLQSTASPTTPAATADSEARSTQNLDAEVKTLGK